MALEKDPATASALIEWAQNAFPYVTTLILSIWGGIVNHLQNLKKSKKRFSWKALIADLSAASFAGLLTHLLCQYAKIDGAIAAVLIAVSGHMGTRAIAGFEILYSRVFNIETKEAAND